MPKVAKGRRKRAYRPRTRSGCLTCKIRRVKCDEKRPECLRCTSTRRICDGYPDSHEQRPHSSPSSIAIVPVTVIAGPSIEIYASLQSKRSFAFFVQRTSPQLAGFFGSDFWERHVLQAAHHESAVRHAIVAIGSLHELLDLQGAMTDPNGAFALEQYNLAIRDLLVPLSQNGERGVDLCLMSCILFACFENMQGHHASAMSHIQSGAKLLRETVYDQRYGVLQHQVLGSRSHMDSYAPLEVLAPIFARMDAQVTLVIRDYKFKLYESYFSAETYDNVAFSFASIEEAKNIFEYGYCLFKSRLTAQLSSCDPIHFPAAVEAHIGYWATLLSKFSLALQELVTSRGPSFTPKDDIAIAVLQLHVLNTYVSFNVEHLPPGYKSRWDEFLPHMKEMVTLGEKVVSSTSYGNDLRGETTSFCSDMGFIIPLYTVASQCRDPILRRKAIALLYSTSRQEGIWNSRLVAKAAERIMEIEESVLGEMNAYTDRSVFSSVQPILELDARGGRLQYVQQGQGANTEVKVVEEMFRW
ncbi:hypothetical protein F5B20DRAFT_523817 [Whalleya microplaca]|nr:hypothetical protein F5B20DRAFT_523817 [Whalleya microplaca]